MDITKTLYGALSYVALYRWVLAKALFFPMALLIPLNFVTIDKFGIALNFLSILLILCLYALVAVTTHRVLLLGPKSVPEWGLYRPTHREGRFLLYMVGLGLLLVPTAFLEAIPDLGFLLSMLAASYLTARLSLVFPAIATDQAMSFPDSWKATKEDQWPLLVVVGLFPWLVSLPERALRDVPYTKPLSTLLWVVAMVLAVAALSIAFKVISPDCESHARPVE